MVTANQASRGELGNLLGEAQRKLDLIFAIDRIRDSDTDPQTMLTGLVTLLTEVFTADLCLLALFDQETKGLELRAVTDKGRHMLSLGTDMLRALTEKAAALDQPDTWDAAALRANGLAEPPTSFYFAAVPIRMC